MLQIIQSIDIKLVIYFILQVIDFLLFLNTYFFKNVKDKCENDENS